MRGADFWSDHARAARISKEADERRTEIETWETLKGELVEARDLAEISEPGDAALKEELQKKVDELEQRFQSLEFRTLFSSEYDRENAIVAVHAGSGGVEANDWTEMLFRMLSRFAAERGFALDVLHESRAEETGLKSVTFRVKGRYAYGYFKSEHGVHRLVRISPFDAEKMRHTTFALVEVIPELEDVKEIDVALKDVRIDTFLASGHGGQGVQTTYSAVRVVHVPTGITVSCQNERSQLQNKETALKILKSKLFQLSREAREKEKQGLRGEYTSADWGNQARSYVLHPYKLVKDHRTEFETTDAEGVLNGKLDGFVEAYLKWKLKEKNKTHA
jgi:peptide chain release factor 2